MFDPQTLSLLEQFEAVQAPMELPKIPPLPPEQIRQELPAPQTEDQCEAI